MSMQQEGQRSTQPSQVVMWGGRCMRAALESPANTAWSSAAAVRLSATVVGSVTVVSCVVLLPCGALLLCEVLLPCRVLLPY